MILSSSFSGARASFATVLVALAASALGGCTSELDDVDATSDELRAACTIGSSCPASLSLLEARSFAPGARPPARFRSDLAIAGAGLEPTPRIVTQSTSRPFTVPSGTTLTLAGDAAGLAPITADDAVLVEVLDAASGALLGSAYFGAAAELRRGGAPLARLGAPGTSFAPGAVDLGNVVPTGKPIRLRVTALDAGGSAGVSAIFAQAKSAAPAPAAPPRSPVSGASCTSRALTAAEVLAFIPPGEQARGLSTGGTLSMPLQTRSCGPTGCAEWKPSDRFGLYEGSITVSHSTRQSDGAEFPVLDVSFFDEKVSKFTTTQCSTHGSSASFHCLWSLKLHDWSGYEQYVDLDVTLFDGCIEVRGRDVRDENAKYEGAATYALAPQP